MKYIFDELRKQEILISKNLIYMDNASISLLPMRTVNKISQIAKELAKEPHVIWKKSFSLEMQKFQQLVAEHINASCLSEIVPITSTSSALNAVAQSIEWKYLDEIICCDLEFPSNVYPWMGLSVDGVRTKILSPVDGIFSLSLLQENVTSYTRLVAVSAIQFFHGSSTDLLSIGEFCKNHNIIFVVDAIQAAGHMPIDVNKMNIDVLASGGHKSLLSPPGIGFLYIRAIIADSLKPRAIHSNSVETQNSWLTYDITPREKTQRFLAGAPNALGIFAMNESLSLIKELVISKIWIHTKDLTKLAIRLITELGFEVVTPPQQAGSIVTFKLPYSSRIVNRVVNQLSEQNIIVGVHLCQLGIPHIRLSFHWYNKKEEIIYFIECIKTIIGEI